MNVFLPRPGHSTRPSEIHAIGRVVRSEQKAPASENPGFAAMNHTTRLRETRGAQGLIEESEVGEFGAGPASDENERISEE
jgi:hypothetical protein